MALCLIFGALFAASAARSDDLSRVLGIIVILSLLLYEPILVSMAGGTIGHYLTNLRVVDDNTHGNVSFLKAVARFLIKGVLGWFSFIFMMATRRNQALHDQLTYSTVQIRDAALAQPGHYIAERTELSNPDLPSRGRRVFIICLYLILIFCLFVLVQAVIFAIGLTSEACVYQDSCRYEEKLLNGALTLAWLAASACVIGLGWRGKIPGTRPRLQQA